MELQDFFKPLSSDFITYLECLPKATLGKNIVQHIDCFPSLDNVQIALFDVREERGAIHNEGCGSEISSIRKEFYALYKGNWQASIVDLGTIAPGNTINDTYFALETVTRSLLKKNIIPIILGGSQDLTYAMYRAYDELDQTVNLTSISPRFNIGSLEDDINAGSYLSKIILNEPANLYHYTNLGYQTYYNSQEELDLIDSLGFEAFRLGELKDISVAEPALRNADVVTIDLSSVRASDAPANRNVSPNGFFGHELCGLSRYAGLSDKVTGFALFEYNKLFDNNNVTAKLVAQSLWYFLEGYEIRAKDYPFCSKEAYLKYTVLHEGEEIFFYQSNKSGRWWFSIYEETEMGNKKEMLIPCSYKDYENSLKNILPNMWFKTHLKIK